MTPGYLTLIQTRVPNGQRGRVLGAGFASIAAPESASCPCSQFSAVYLLGGATVLWQLD